MANGGTFILRRDSCQWNETEEAANVAVCVAICSTQVKIPPFPCK